MVKNPAKKGEFPWAKLV